MLGLEGGLCQSACDALWVELVQLISEFLGPHIGASAPLTAGAYGSGFQGVCPAGSCVVVLPHLTDLSEEGSFLEMQGEVMDIVPAWGRGLPASALGWSEQAWLLSFSCAPGCGRGALVSCLLCPVDSGKGP